MRTVSVGAQSALSGSEPVPIVAFLELQLSSMFYLCTAGVDIDWNGHTWLATGLLGSIDIISDTATELSGLKFTLSGVSSDALALSLGENIQGAPAIMRIAMLDPQTHAVIDVQDVWSGTLDQMTTSGGTISVTAEHRGISMQRPNAIRYTDADQQRLYPGDRCLEYIVAQSQSQDVWPAASWFKQ